MNTIRPQVSPEFSEFIGISYSKMNCWDLAVFFYSKVLNLDLTWAYDGYFPGRDATRDLIYTNIGKFERVEDPEMGDLILIKIFGIESHIAIYLGEGKMLHTTKNTGSVIERVSRWKVRITGFYRVKQ